MECQREILPVDKQCELWHTQKESYDVCEGILSLRKTNELFVEGINCNIHF